MYGVADITKINIVYILNTKYLTKNKKYSNRSIVYVLNIKFTKKFFRFELHIINKF